MLPRTSKALLCLLAASALGLVAPQAGNAAVPPGPTPTPPSLPKKDVQTVPGPVDARIAAQADRLLVITKINEMMDAAPGQYAGLATDGPQHARLYLAAMPGGRLVDAAASTAASALADEGKKVGLAIAVSTKTRSLRDLYGIRDRLVKTAPFGNADNTLGWEVSVDPDANVLELRVHRGEGRSIAAKSSRILGDAVRVVEKPADTEGDREQGSRVADTEPFYAGDQIRGAPNVCTSGFTLTNAYGTHYAITAGHCFPKNAYITQNAAFFGNVDFRNTPANVNNPNDYWYDDELIGGGQYSGVMWRGDQYNPQPIGVHAPADSCINCQVYLSSGYSSQHLQTLSGNPYCERRTDGWVCGMQRTTPGGTNVCQDGDSGSPYYAYDGRGGVYAVGNHSKGSAGYCIYTSVPSILRRWSSTITTSP